RSSGGPSMKLQGLHYDADRKRAVLDGFVPGTGGTVRRQRTIENVTKAQAFAEWKKFRADLESGRAIDGPMTMQQFVDLFFDDIGENHQESTRSTQRTLLDCQILPYFGKTKLEEISSIRVAK